MLVFHLHFKKMKYKIEAKYYEKVEDGINCKLCPHNCFLTEGKTGICRTRVNHGNILYTIAYNNPIAINIDPIEKKPLFHFFPSSKTFSIATEGCNSRCLNCQNSSISQVAPTQDYNEKFSPENIVKSAILNNCNSISYTYTDPIVFYEYTLDIAKIAKEKGIKNIIVSSGYINENPLSELAEYIDAANIDLKVFDENIYKKLCGTDLNPVLNTLKFLKEKNVWLEITNLIIPEWSDNLKTIEKMCKWLMENGFEDTPIHFNKFSPLYKLNHLYPTKTETLINAYEIAKKTGLKYVFMGNVWNLDNENTICPSCETILIKRQGFRIEYNKITENKCLNCGMKISGIWQ